MISICSAAPLEMPTRVLALWLRSAVTKFRWLRGIMAIVLGRRFGACLFACGSVFAAGYGAGISVADAQTAVSDNSGVTLPSLGQLNAPDPYHELETKYLFGFTEGADIGAEGEQSIEYETTTSSGKRGWGYNVLEQEVEYENVPTQNFGYELSAHGLAYSIHNIEG